MNVEALADVAVEMERRGMWDLARRIDAVLVQAYEPPPGLDKLVPEICRLLHLVDQADKNAQGPAVKLHLVEQAIPLASAAGSNGVKGGWQLEIHLEEAAKELKNKVAVPDGPAPTWRQHLVDASKLLGCKISLRRGEADSVTADGYRDVPRVPKPPSAGSYVECPAGGHNVPVDGMGRIQPHDVKSGKVFGGGHNLQHPDDLCPGSHEHYESTHPERKKHLQQARQKMLHGATRTAYGNPYHDLSKQVFEADDMISKALKEIDDVVWQLKHKLNDDSWTHDLLTVSMAVHAAARGFMPIMRRMSAKQAAVVDPSQLAELVHRIAAQHPDLAAQVDAAIDDELTADMAAAAILAEPVAPVAEPGPPAAPPLQPQAEPALAAPPGLKVHDKVTLQNPGRREDGQGGHIIHVNDLSEVGPEHRYIVQLDNGHRIPAGDKELRKASPTTAEPKVTVDDVQVEELAAITVALEQRGMGDLAAKLEAAVTANWWNGKAFGRARVVQEGQVSHLGKVWLVNLTAMTGHPARETGSAKLTLLHGSPPHGSGHDWYVVLEKEEHIPSNLTTELAEAFPGKHVATHHKVLAWYPWPPRDSAPGQIDDEGDF